MPENSAGKDSMPHGQNFTPLWPAFMVTQNLNDKHAASKG